MFCLNPISALRVGEIFLPGYRLKTNKNMSVFELKQECNKQFSQFNNLKLHKKIHQRPIYSCKICNKQYKSHKCFNKHIIKSH